MPRPGEFRAPPNRGLTLSVRYDRNTQNRRFGYARVSTYAQTCDAQLEQARRKLYEDLSREG
jgi:hypothetical protein